MSNLVWGLISLIAAAGLLWMAVRQWRSGQFIDPLFTAATDEFTKRAALVCTTVIYAFIGTAAILIGFHFLLIA